MNTITASRRKVRKKKKKLKSHHAWFFFIAATRMLTARLCASNPSTAANCSTVRDNPSNPSAVKFELVMCLRNEPRLTPEYCLA